MLNSCWILQPGTRTVKIEKSSLELSLMHFQRNLIPAVSLLCKQTRVKVKYEAHSPP